MNKHKGKIVIGVITLLIAVGIFFVLKAPNAYAHEHRSIGDYDVVFGWQEEPIYAGFFNGPELFVTNTKTNKPVTGLEETLALTVTFGPASKQLALEPAEDDPGHYIAYLTPTRPGDYNFQLSGVISETTAVSETVVNETFSSADGEFESVDPAKDVLFPDDSSDNVSLQKEIDDLKDQITTLKAEVDKLSAASK
jgi:hypothetical protein